MCPAYIVQIVSINRTSDRSTAGIGMLGIICAVVFAVLAGLNYMVQLTVARSRIMAEKTNGVEWLVFQKSSSLMIELDFAGWLFLGMALLSMVPVFRGRGLNRVIKYVLIANALVDLILVGILFIAYSGIGQVLLAMTTVLLTIAGVLLLAYFRRISRTRHIIKRDWTSKERARET